MTPIFLQIYFDVEDVRMCLSGGSKIPEKCHDLTITWCVMCHVCLSVSCVTSECVVSRGPMAS